MSDISKIRIGDIQYDISDDEARRNIDSVNERIDNLDANEYMRLQKEISKHGLNEFGREVGTSDFTLEKLQEGKLRLGDYWKLPESITHDDWYIASNSKWRIVDLNPKFGFVTVTGNNIIGSGLLLMLDAEILKISDGTVYNFNIDILNDNVKNNIFTVDLSTGNISATSTDLSIGYKYQGTNADRYCSNYIASGLRRQLSKPEVSLIPIESIKYIDDVGQVVDIIYRQCFIPSGREVFGIQWFSNINNNYRIQNFDHQYALLRYIPSLLVTKSVSYYLRDINKNGAILRTYPVSTLTNQIYDSSSQGQFKPVFYVPITE